MGFMGKKFNDERIKSRNSLWYLSYYIQDYSGNTRLHDYIIRSPIYNASARKLIDATWPVGLLDIRNNLGLTALHMAAVTDEADLARYLLVAGANPMIKDNDGFIPLHYACIFGNNNMVTALMRAFDTEEVAKMDLKNLKILNLYQTIYMKNNSGHTPSDAAMAFGHISIEKFLRNAQEQNLTESK